MLKLVIWIIVLGVIMVGGLAIFNSQIVATGTIKIGLIAPLTGAQSAYGISESQAAQVAVDQINAAGGVSGKNLTLVIEDGQCDASTAGAAAQKLIAADRVKIIIGGGCAVETAAIAIITQPAQVVVLALSAIGAPATIAGDFVFKIYQDDAAAGAIAANYAIKELRVKKASVLAEDNPAGQILSAAYKKTFGDLARQIVMDEVFPTDAVNFSGLTSRIKNADPDQVYIAAQSTSSIAAIVKILRDASITATIAISADLESRFISNNAQFLEGILSVQPTIDWENNAKARNLRDAYRIKFGGQDPGPFAGNAYDAVGLIQDAVTATAAKGMVDAGAVRDWLATVKNWPGALGPITIGEDRATIITENIQKISGGAKVDLGPYAP